ncbi:hypothetical protein SPRG_14591 [Saprolegnia parasitica CBS 223.65]|uniref:Uncharacterized protein n=1 Tax=Saprolegnia parasitica (strain CBS 223.65) TaxID=695850 RepID=A0A067C0M9_SAPPC|nr:hypothetical protein SPRG_14591 [Saprolegnia parasitica CBS 223.65]KDO20111.1 hypothetical protein SPRG_14591 [Saprolegnia parasitica CBS 223.65]|eukprot:XP_012209155.1 hypothetical protein SPRG_14591 [Saprolegnia parasitica CBS 223.65]
MVHGCWFLLPLMWCVAAATDRTSLIADCADGTLAGALAPTFRRAHSHACATQFGLRPDELMLHDNFTTAEIEEYANSVACKAFYTEVMDALRAVSPVCVVPSLSWTTQDIAQLTFADKVAALRRQPAS